MQETNLNLLVVSYLYAPDKCGGAPIFTDFCEGLVERGINVTVRCAYPFYPEWKDKSGCNGIHVSKQTINGVHVERYGMYIPTNPKSIAQRMFYEATHFLSLSRSLFSGSFDASVVFCPLMASTAFGAVHKIIHRIPSILDIEDLPANAAAASGITKHKFVVKLFTAIQKFLLGRYDAVRTITPVMADSLDGVVNKPMVTIPHWVHPHLRDEIASHGSKVNRRLGDTLNLFYSGNIGGKQGLINFCKILSHTDLKFRFRICGDGAGADELQVWLSRNPSDDRFSLEPLGSEAELALRLFDTDFCVITEKPDKTASFFPSKLIPIITSGTPILSVCDQSSPLGVEVLSHNLGLWLPWDTSITDMVSKITSLTNFGTWQENAIQRSIYYDRERCLDQWYETINQVLAAY